jgi:hypothetical protein
MSIGAARKIDLHFRYVSAILLGIIVALLTSELGATPQIVDKMSFGLGLASMVLGLVAIGYAFLSNSSLASTIASIDRVSEKVSSTTQGLDRAALELKATISEIPERLQGVEDKVDQTHRYVREGKETSSASHSSSPDEVDDESLIENIVDRTSVIALMVYQALHLAERQSVSLDIRKISEIAFGTEDNYVVGLLVATSSVGLLSFRHDGDLLKEIDINDRLGKLSQERFEGKVNDAFADSPDWARKIFADMKRLEAYVLDRPTSEEAVSAENQDTQDRKKPDTH